MNKEIKSTIPSASRRQLIAFSFVEESYLKSGDIVSGLLQLFAPLLAKRAGRIFDPFEFSKDVQDTYDIPMSPIVAEGLVEQLAAAELLRLDDTSKRTYRVASNPLISLPAVDPVFDELLENFNKFAKVALGRFEIESDESVIESGFIKRLTTVHFLSFVDRREKNYFKGGTLSLQAIVDEEQDIVHLEQALDVICAEFALRTMDEGGSGADLLSRMVSGALIAETVLTLQTPSSGESLSKLSVIFDGPLILDFLDLSTPELHDYAVDLIDLVKKAGSTIVVLNHTIEEMKGTLHGPLKALERGEEPYGPLGSRIRTDSQLAAYARAIHDGLEAKLIAVGFKILDAEEIAKKEPVRFCSLRTEEDLRNNIGEPMFNLERRIRDSRSVATVLRLRGDAQSAGSIADTEWIMITRNDTVAKRSQRFLEFKKLISAAGVPPAITDRRLAGYLWFAVGGSIGALSTKKLVANCSYVVTPRTDVVSKARQYLSELDPKKADVFVALMRDQRAQRCLVHLTLGFPSAIRLDNAEELLEEIKLSVAAEVQTRAEAREIELQTMHAEKISSLTNQQELIKMENDTAILLYKENVEKEKKEAARQAELKEERERELNNLKKSVFLDVDKRIKSAAGSANMATKILVALIIFAYLALVASAYWLLPNDRIIGGFITLIVSIAAFWIVPQYIYDRLATPLWMWRFSKKCRELEVSKHINDYSISPLKRTVECKLPLDEMLSLSSDD